MPESILSDEFTAFPDDNGDCNTNTKAVNTIHEISHLAFTVGSSDYDGCYGFNCLQGLSADQNLNHADSYALYAQGTYSISPLFFKFFGNHR